MRKERILTRGGFVESPVNTFTLTMDSDTTVKTGITEFKLVNNTDGSNIADLQFTFVSNTEAIDFRLHGAGFVFCGDYGQLADSLPVAVDDKINDSLIFNDEEVYNDFLNQVKGDLSLELSLPLPYYK